MEELQTRHRKEQRDLQSKVTQKKKSATKKTRKGVNDECAELERSLRDRQQAEVAALSADPASDTNNPSDEDAAEPSDPQTECTTEKRNGNLPGHVSQESGEYSADGATSAPKKPVPESPTTDTVTGSEQPRKPNRQKARLAKRAAEKEALAAEAANEAAKFPDLRAIERAAMRKEFETHGLEEKEIRPDGHCLYSAMADQLRQAGIGLKPKFSLKLIDSKAGERVDEMDDYRIVRHSAAEFIARNPDDFIPFLEEPLDEYTNKIRSTAEWGGQLELLALAKAYEVEIHVIQGSSRLEKIVPDNGADCKTIWLAYYRHNFGLGEHYNSLRKKP